MKLFLIAILATLIVGCAGTTKDIVVTDQDEETTEKLLIDADAIDDEDTEQLLLDEDTDTLIVEDGE